MTALAASDNGPDRGALTGKLPSELARIANDADDAADDHAGKALGKLIESGKALLAAQEQILHGEWKDWLAAHYKRSESHAFIRTRLARNEALILDTVGLGASLNAALRVIEAAGKRPERHGRAHPPEVRQRAQALHEQGHSPKEIALAVAVSPTTVAVWLDPELERKRTERARKAYQERKRRAEEAEKRSVQQAARKAGGARHEAFAMVERFQDVIANAQREAESRAERAAWAEAGIHSRKMRDDVVRAFGMS